MRRLMACAGAMTLLASAAMAQTTEDFAGREVRRSTLAGGEERYDVWRLAEDGSLTGNYSSGWHMTPRGGHIASGAVAGRWSVDAGALCLEGAGLEAQGRICYALEKVAANEIKTEYRARSSADGSVWTVFVYNGG